ncbi:MAG: dihydroorotase [Bacteroidetes bacterium]|nr:MAG: dihydroorotase [Bacteroidota bacterium]REK04870.1 MAG: dihydroorotase [Bacteroidota bacterium]REK36342.1 MAG: dihydroorotase [Bacteroidota bacterium]REK50992.1 MAG: dihydroorotase [Bacteroidota bacterium]
MKKSLLIKNASIVNEGVVRESDILIQDSRISRIDRDISDRNAQIIDAKGLHVFPGVIDDQVHFREPGLTHKGDISTESRAAVAGGVTSFMEMPNTVPNTLTQDLLEEKYKIAAAKSPANFSFYMGVSNDNTEDVLKTDPRKVCGVKIFMGSSTGDMLVDNQKTLEKIFSTIPMLIATHCEDEESIRKNIQEFREKYGDELPMKMHPLIRSEDACYKSSSFAVSLAKKYNTRLHVLHISTAKELDLLRNDIPLKEKRITAEACIHHLWFDDTAYDQKGTLIKWNPAIKTKQDRDAIRQAVLDNRIDVIATDHAPHTLEEKQQSYFKAPSGGPLIQHSLLSMLELYHQGWISLERIAEKMSHAVADCFRIEDRGYIREGYWADLALVNLKASYTVTKDNILAKCGWSPFMDTTFRAGITHTIVSGNLVYEHGNLIEGTKGMRLTFKTT